MFVLALDNDEEHVQGWNICRDRGLLPTLLPPRTATRNAETQELLDAQVELR